MKRYSIVRVDDDYKHICPSAFEKVDDSSFCKLAIRKGGSCNVCPYGDTKEQLIRKILQVMMRKYTISYLRTTRQDKINPKHFKSAIDYYLEIAKEIVEFLGVE